MLSDIIKIGKKAAIQEGMNMIPRIFSEPVTIRDAAGSTLMVIPEWICYLCYAFFLILIVYMITSLGKMLMKNICSKRRKVWAVLELKMQEHPIPAAIHTVDENINRDGQKHYSPGRLLSRSLSTSL